MLPWETKRNKIRTKITKTICPSIDLSLSIHPALYPSFPNWQRAVELLEKYFNGIIFLIIKQLGVNYSAYTTVATLQDIDQMIYFKSFVRFFYFKSLLWVGLFIPHLIQRLPC